MENHGDILERNQGSAAMKTSPVTAADFSASVMAVPPLALSPDLTVAPVANRAIIRHIEGGGVSTLLYAGNANVYNLAHADYAAMLDLIAEAAGAESWVIPGLGPDFGKMMDQARLLRDRGFPTALTLPTAQAIHPAGVADGLRRVADRFRRPLMVYLKSAGYLRPDQVGALVAEGVVCGIKYAIDRADPLEDPYLDALLQRVDRRVVVSGMGERPAVAHTARTRLAGFTSGLVCIAPAAAQAILRAVQAGRVEEATALAAAFKPLEDAREQLGFIRVLHALLRLAGIADTGPMMPLLAGLDAGEMAQVEPLLARFRQATAAVTRAA